MTLFKSFFVAQEIQFEATFSLEGTKSAEIVFKKPLFKMFLWLYTDGRLWQRRKK